MTAKNTTPEGYDLYREYDAAGQLLYVDVIDDVASRPVIWDADRGPWGICVAKVIIDRYESFESAWAARCAVISDEDTVFNERYGSDQEWMWRWLVAYTAGRRPDEIEPERLEIFRLLRNLLERRVRVRARAAGAS